MARQAARPGPLAVVAALLALLALPRRAAPAPQSFAALECAVNAFAAQLAASKLPPAAESDVRDALNVDLVCGNSSSSAASATAEAAEALAPHAAAIALERARHAAAREELRDSVTRPGAVATFFVATDGSDATGDGSEAMPFATLPRAAAAARAVPSRSPGDVTVFVRAGTYYMGGAGGGGGVGGGGALVLSEADSNVAWAAFPGDAPAPVVLSGAVQLGALSWANTTAGAVPGILVATVGGLPPDARTLAWQAAHPGEVGRAGPPPLVASLFVNGVRQVRARYPNGNPQDTSGVCFSATQRPGEGCAGYTGCVRGQTGSQPAPAGVRVDGLGPNRGDSPTWGCPQCGTYGSFGYTVYPPPADHPVYNMPLPGVGWSNTSVFSFWGSPFDRPAGVLIDSTCNENGNHWSRVNYSNPTGAVVHMFHGGLWGGWSFMVDNVTAAPPSASSSTSNAAAAAAAAAVVAAAASGPPPNDIAVWLDASAISGVADGAPLALWPDASGLKRDASQLVAAKQPTYVAKGRAGGGGGMPAVRFAGAQVLAGGGGLPASTTMLAVVTDTGSTTAYCSGVFTGLGGLNSLCTQRATAGSPAPADDDPPTPGSSIIATALDWGGSPVAPGHRDLRNKPTVLAALYSGDQSEAVVDGCLELSENPGNGAPSQGFMVGSRNDEDGRYLIGDVSEVLVYSRLLNTSELAQAVAYLSAKWGIVAPKHCAGPPAPPADVRVNFGYGGFQEARGSGVNGGQVSRASARARARERAICSLRNPCSAATAACFIGRAVPRRALLSAPSRRALLAAPP
jgi:hypothetical protein